MIGLSGHASWQAWKAYLKECYSAPAPPTPRDSIGVVAKRIISFGHPALRDPSVCEDVSLRRPGEPPDAWPSDRDLDLAVEEASWVRSDFGVIFPTPPVDIKSSLASLPPAPLARHGGDAPPPARRPPDRPRLRPDRRRARMFSGALGLGALLPVVVAWAALVRVAAGRRRACEAGVGDRRAVSSGRPGGRPGAARSCERGRPKFLSDVGVWGPALGESWHRTHCRSGTTVELHWHLLVFHWCHSGTALVIHWCFDGAPLVLHWCGTGNALVLRWCCAGTALILRMCCIGTALVLHWY